MESRIKSIDQMYFLTLNVGFSHHNADWNWKQVSSPFARLYYVTKGHARIVFLDGVHELTPGNLYLIPAFTMHSYECDGIFEHYYIHMYEDTQSNFSFMEDFVFPLEVPAKEIDQFLFQRLCEINPTMKLPQSNPESYDNNVTLIQNISKNKRRILCDRVESRGILYQLTSRFLKDARLKVESGDNRIMKCLAYIRKNINQNIKID